MLISIIDGQTHSVGCINIDSLILFPVHLEICLEINWEKERMFFKIFLSGGALQQTKAS